MKTHNTPTVSIVMPVYNGEKYIKESVESILCQTYTNFELIIINDGSTDNTASLIENYNDNRIKIINNKHDFIDSLNLGITHAQGKYIARMDADDIMLSNRIEKQYNYMEENLDIDICGTWMEIFGNNNGTISKIKTSHRELLLASIWGNPLYHPTVMMKKELRDKFGQKKGIYQMYDKKYIYAEDYKLWVELIEMGFKFANIPEVLLKYRSSDTQITKVKSAESFRISFKIQNEYLEYVMQLIVDENNDYYEFINSLIHNYNENKIDFTNLTQIIHDIYKEYLILS